MAATACASRRVGAEPAINASVAVGYDQPGHAISENFIGLSYESAVLASPEHLSPGNLSIMGLLRGLGPGGVLRLGGNSSARMVWRNWALVWPLGSSPALGNEANSDVIGGPHAAAIA